MRKPTLTWDDLPEYADDDDIGEVVLGRDRKGDFHRLATLREKDGMPKIDTFWGGRPKWLVKRFLEADQRLAPAETPVARKGVKGEWNKRDQRLPA